MKTAVSTPDDVFEQAERLARRSGQTRSYIFSQALREYLTRHSPEEVTRAMDEVCEAVGDPLDPFAGNAARHTLERIEW